MLNKDFYGLLELKLFEFGAAFYFGPDWSGTPIVIFVHRACSMIKNNGTSRDSLTSCSTDNGSFFSPQVGQWDCKSRQDFLEDKYSFRCWCRGCSELNLSDLVLNAFQCGELNCFGAVLDSCTAQYEKRKIDHLFGVPPIHRLEPHVQVFCIPLCSTMCISFSKPKDPLKI